MSNILKKIILILIIVFTISSIFSGCEIKKSYNSCNDYKNEIERIVKSYDWNIENEACQNDYYHIELSSGVKYEQISISFNIGNSEQYNSFDINCINPVSYDEIFSICNAFSRKEFSEEFCYNVIHNDDRFLNCEENCIDTSNYSFYKIDYLDSFWQDYCVIYYSEYDAGRLVLTGFTK